jgi:hypothetical protein
MQLGNEIDIAMQMNGQARTALDTKLYAADGRSFLACSIYRPIQSSVEDLDEIQ